MYNSIVCAVYERCKHVQWCARVSLCVMVALAGAAYWRARRNALVHNTPREPTHQVPTYTAGVCVNPSDRLIQRPTGSSTAGLFLICVFVKTKSHRYRKRDDGGLSTRFRELQHDQVDRAKNARQPYDARMHTNLSSRSSVPGQGGLYHGITVNVRGRHEKRMESM